MELIERSQDGTLTDEERLEAEDLIRFERMVNLLKAKALVAIYDHESNT